jgi:alkanesulfonate monooxygenase SsuD/methylene tetrahydromethanopterin reductase-like flavin-dependent oxidoreductase (luciferase family)
VKRSLLYQVGSSEQLPFEAVFEQAELAESSGLEAIWCFPSAGAAGDFRESAPAIWLAALARRTERIRLGWGLAAMTPPVDPPIRIAEQAASLDLASRGRLELGLVPDGELRMDDSAPWDEGVRMLVDMWDAPAFSWTSPRFDVKPVDVLPKPVQRPHPPLWLAGWSPEHAVRAGEAGFAFLDLSGATDEFLAQHFEAYTEARSGADPNDLVSVALFAVAADLDPGDQATKRLARWEKLGIDQAVLRAGPIEGGHAQALERIRFLAAD